MKVRQAVIMVGGKGTRLLPLTENRPKPMLSVADKPCIWYLVRSLARAGIEEILMACGYKPGVMENLGDGSDLGVRIRYFYEDEPMGTAGAMKLLESQLDEVFVAANGDVFADIDVDKEVEVHFANDSDITIALTPVSNPCEFGIVRVDETGRILEFKEKPRPEEVFSNLINAGVYVMDRSVLRFVPEGVFFDFSKDLVPLVMADGGHIHGFELSGLWMDVGRPHDLLGANLSVAERSGTQVAERVKGPFYLGDGATVVGSEIDHAVILMGASVDGSVLDHALVMKNSTVVGSTLRNTIVGEGCTIGEGSVITNAVLADNTVMEPGTVMDGGRIV